MSPRRSSAGSDRGFASSTRRSRSPDWSEAPSALRHHGGEIGPPRIRGRELDGAVVASRRGVEELVGVVGATQLTVGARALRVIGGGAHSPSLARGRRAARRSAPLPRARSRRGRDAERSKATSRPVQVRRGVLGGAASGGFESPAQAASASAMAPSVALVVTTRSRFAEPPALRPDAACGSGRRRGRPTLRPCHRAR